MVKITYDLQNSNIKVMAKVKPIGHIWGLEFKSICLLFVSWQSGQFWLRYIKIHISPWKFGVKVMSKVKPNGHIWGLEINRYVCFSFRGNRTIFDWDIANSTFDLTPDLGHQMVKITYDLQNSNIKVMAKVKPIGHIWGLEFKSICLLFVSWQSGQFWLRYIKIHISPWKFGVKVMSKVKPNGHIWGLEINRYVCFSFRGNRTIFDWDIANSTFDLENSRSRSWPRSKPMVTFEA